MDSVIFRKDCMKGMKKRGLILAVLLASAALLLGGCISAPNLSVEGVNGADHFGITTGCYTTVSGTVKNRGNASAEDVTVFCSTMQEGTIIDTQNKGIGSIKADSERLFSIDLDTDCFKGAVSYECTADCSNC